VQLGSLTQLIWGLVAMRATISGRGGTEISLNGLPPRGNESYLYGRPHACLPMAGLAPIYDEALGNVDADHIEPLLAEGDKAVLRPGSNHDNVEVGDQHKLVASRPRRFERLRRDAHRRGRFQCPDIAAVHGNDVRPHPLMYCGTLELAGVTVSALGAPALEFSYHHCKYGANVVGIAHRPLADSAPRHS
jgi:hypothetical protein